VIEVEHLTKCYGAHRAVDDVSFEVARGEVVALLGPNGSGKSTLMRCVTGFFSPTSGHVRVGGVDVGARPVEARRHLGYLPEQVMLYPELTVERYLRFAAGAKGLAGAARRRAVADVVERCGLRDVVWRPTGKLSKGYRQRVGLAQALVADPEVLVLDEPTVGLDPVQTVELRELVRGLAGRTVLVSTHILSEASLLCSRVVILQGGRLVAVDTPDELARRVGQSSSILVRIDGPAADVRAALAAIPGVRAVDLVDGAASGAGVVLRISADDTAPVQRAIGGVVVPRGWALLEVRAETPTLEDLFMRLVG
jgi:gliding motility-associated transport system ATP-binding protein